MIRLATFVKY